jgi:hypothetical protein
MILIVAKTMSVQALVLQAWDPKSTDSLCVMHMNNLNEDAPSV